MIRALNEAGFTAASRIPAPSGMVGREKSITSHMSGDKPNMWKQFVSMRSGEDAWSIS
jgi:hypothetical protein